MLFRSSIDMKKSTKTKSTSRRGKGVPGATAKEQRQYEHIKESAQKEGRYGGRAKEVAARTVNKLKQQRRRKRKAS